MKTVLDTFYPSVVEGKSFDLNYREALSLKYVWLIDDSLPVSKREQTAYPLLPGEICTPSGPGVFGKTCLSCLLSVPGEREIAVCRGAGACQNPQSLPCSQEGGHSDARVPRVRICGITAGKVLVSSDDTAVVYCG